LPKNPLSAASGDILRSPNLKLVILLLIYKLSFSNVAFKSYTMCPRGLGLKFNMHACCWPMIFLMILRLCVQVPRRIYTEKGNKVINSSYFFLVLLDDGSHPYNPLASGGYFGFSRLRAVFSPKRKANNID